MTSQLWLLLEWSRRQKQLGADGIRARSEDAQLVAGFHNMCCSVDAQHEAFCGARDVDLQFPGSGFTDTNAAGTFQFHQVSVWALLQDTLAFFEGASALGRTIPWAFEGNRLMAQAQGQGANELNHLGNRVFGMAFDPALRVTFVFEGSKVTKLTLLQGGATIEGPRVP